MPARRRCRRSLVSAAPGLALALWTTACHTRQAYRPPPPGAGGAARHAGRERVVAELPRNTRLIFRSAAGDTMSAVVERLSGRLADVRGDTIVIDDVRVGNGRLQVTRPNSEVALEAASVQITPDAHAYLGVERLDGARTTVLVVGVVAGLLIAAAIAAGSTDYVGTPNVSLSRHR